APLLWLTASEPEAAGPIAILPQPLTAHPRHCWRYRQRSADRSETGRSPVARPSTNRRQGLRPGEPPEGKLNRSEGDGGEKFGEVVEITAEPPVSPKHEKVRSTTQRRGRTTKPFMSKLRLTISKHNRGTFAAAAST